MVHPTAVVQLGASPGDFALKDTAPNPNAWMWQTRPVENGRISDMLLLFDRIPKAQGEFDFFLKTHRISPVPRYSTSRTSD
jgi:hypothetical protein